MQRRLKRKGVWIYGSVIILMLCVLLLVTGCTTEIGCEKAAKKAEQELESKYTTSLDVKRVRERKIESTFARREYLVELLETNNPKHVFQASMDLDGSDLKDNYGMVLFGDLVESENDELFKVAKNIEIKKQSFQYELTEGKWDDFDSYKQAHNVQLTYELKLLDRDKGTALHTAYDWMKTMEERNYDFIVSFDYTGECRSVICNLKYHLPTLEEWLEKWR